MASGNIIDDDVSTYSGYDWNVAATGSAAESEQNTKSTHHGWNAVRAALNELSEVHNGARLPGVQVQTTHHSWSDTDNSANHVPWNGNAELTEAGGEDYRVVCIAPRDGWLIEALFNSTAALGNTGIELFKSNGDQNAVSTSAGTEVVVSISADTTATYAFGSAYAFTKGQILTVVISPTTNTSYDGVLTLAWAYDYRT